MERAFTPRKAVMRADGSMSSGVDNDAKEFVKALRKLIQEFGNVEKSFVEKLGRIGEESEEVARKIYALGDKDVSEIQDEAFHKRSVSVWELERLELSESFQGRKAPWEFAQPAGFKDGKKQV